MQVLHKASKKTTASSQIWGFQANILAKAHHLGVAGCSPETKIWPTTPRLLLQPGNSGSVQIFSALDIPFPFHLCSSWAERVPWGSAASERPEVQLLVKPQGLMAAARGRSGGGTAGPRAAPTLWETKLQPAFLRLWLLARRSQTAWPEGTKALDKWTATPRMHRAKPLPFPFSGTSGISASAYVSPWAEPGGGVCVEASQPTRAASQNLRGNRRSPLTSAMLPGEAEACIRGLGFWPAFRFWGLVCAWLPLRAQSNRPWEEKTV